MFNPLFRSGQLLKKNKKIIWRGHNGAEEYGKNTHLRILCRSHTPFEIWSASRAVSPTGLISSSFKCPRYTIEYNVFFFFKNFWRKVAFRHLTGTIACGPRCPSPLSPCQAALVLVRANARMPYALQWPGCPRLLAVMLFGE